MRKLIPWLCVVAVTSTGCKPKNGNSDGLELPNVELVKELPDFTPQQNEVEIADSFTSVDRTLVLGALVHRDSGEVRSFINFLKTDAKPVTKLDSEVVFRNFVESSLVVEGGWLEFLKLAMNDSVRAEISVVKTSSVTIPSNGFDFDKLKRYADSSADSDDFGVIIAYTDYVVSASLFKNSGSNVAASGYGAQIKGKWYSKNENKAGHHRIIAVWTTAEILQSLAPAVTNSAQALDKAIQEAIGDEPSQVPSIPGPLRITTEAPPPTDAERP